MNLNSSILTYLLFLATLTLGIKPELTTIPFILIVIFWFISFFKKEVFFNKENLTLLLFTSSTFIVGLLGLINTSNFSAASFELSRTLPIFLLPFILFTLKQTFSNKTISLMLSGFIIGCLLKTLFILSFAFIRYIDTGNAYYFFYTYLLRETGSFSYYLVLAYFLCLWVFNKKDIFGKYLNQKAQNFILIFSLLLFALVIILLQTKSVIIYFYLTNALFLIIYFKKSQSKLMFFTLVFCSLFIIVFGKEMRFISFFKEEKVMIEQKAPDLNAKAEQSLESTSLRKNSIITTLDIIKSHFLLGVGTGDLTDEMTIKYKEFGFIYNYQEQTNPHNQYLRTFGKNGILGILALLAFFAFNFLYWIKTKSPILLAFNLIILLSCMTNDLFDTGGGAPLIGLMLPLIYLWSKTDTESNIHTVETN